MLLFCVLMFKWNKDLNEQWKWSPSTYLLFFKPSYPQIQNSVDQSLHHPKNLSPPSSWEGDTMIIRSAYVKDSKWDAARVNFTATDLQFLWVRRFLFPSAVAVNIVSPASHVFGDILVGSIIINLKHIQETVVFFRVQNRKETQAWKEIILKKVKLKMVTESIKLRKL